MNLPGLPMLSKHEKNFCEFYSILLSGKDHLCILFAYVLNVGRCYAVDITSDTLRKCVVKLIFLPLLF